jgi:protein phosphatase
LNEKYHGRTCSAVYGLCLHGETKTDLDESGAAQRVDWSMRYNGTAEVVYGHTPHSSPEWRNRTFNVDTGCVFGGTLSALRWPEKNLVSVPAHRLYAVPARPLDDLPLVPPSSAPRI